MYAPYIRQIDLESPLKIGSKLTVSGASALMMFSPPTSTMFEESI